MSDIYTGVDRRDRGTFVATTGSESGRTAIQSLRQITEETDSPADWVGNAGVRVAIPEPPAMVKSIRIAAGDEPPVEDRLRFEMSCSLLESADKFIFATQATGNDCRYLGMMLRRDRAARYCDSLGCDFESNGNRLSFQLRAIGLGLGYLTFCRKEEAELVCLTDLTSSAASICLVSGSHIVDVASLATADFDLQTEAGRERFAVDLKTIINFRQATLMEAGISVPVSSLLFAGDDVDDGFREIVGKYFPVGVKAPRMHDGFLAGLDIDDPELLTLFLVALGMAVN